MQVYAPSAPQAIRDEATIRLAGWLAGASYDNITSETSVGPDTIQYQVGSQNLMIRTGAGSLLTRWRVRRGRSHRLMRWPWSKREKRESGGDFADAVVRLLETQAAGSAADASSTAAVEAASGVLSRAFASAEVVGEPWVQDCVSAAFLGQVGRDLIRRGDSMHVVRVGADGWCA